MSNLKIAFFGTPELAAIVLDELKQSGIMPNLIVCNPDVPVGRKHVLTQPPAKLWSSKNNVDILQPISLKEASSLPELAKEQWDLFIVAAYGKLLPAWLLALPKYGTLNVHPSLLPKLRGASPIRSAILQDIRETGVSVMLLDEELDHGPLLAQMDTTISKENWPVRGRELDLTLAQQGGALLASIIPNWVEGKILPTEQDHEKATFCTKICKEMSELIIDPAALPAGKAAYDALLKIRAFDGWPETFFIHEGKRIKIKDVSISPHDQLVITRIIPEGKKEIDWGKYFS